MDLATVNVAPIEHLLQEGWDRRASDIHLNAGWPPMLRIGGDLWPSETVGVLEGERVAGLLEEMLPPEATTRFIEQRQLDFSFGWGESRYRGNAFMQRGMASLALRSIPTQIPTPEDLLLPPLVSQLCAQRQGLILITGPTGSGKSTTQAAMIGLINGSQRRHILTLEDPIEYVHENKASIISQREVGTDVLSFAAGLKSALREDPDVILVGEMRDAESIAATLTLAETGHLVLATLHTNDASTALDRIIDVFPNERQAQIRVQLAASLSAIVAQRLVPRTDQGVIAAFELLIATSAVRGLIRDGKSHQIRNVISQSIREGMQTLEQSLTLLAGHGLISYDDALAAAVVPREVKPPAGAVPR